MSTSAAIGIPEKIRRYVERWGVRPNEILARCRAETASDPRAGMQIEADQGALMQVLARAIGARRALEVGVFTGYSSTAVALALKEMHGNQAQLVACDLSEEFVSRARAYWRSAGVEDVIEVRLGSGETSLRSLIDEGRSGSFDFMFIDADKPSYDAYYEAGLVLLRAGGLMLIDNMLWSGQVADSTDVSESTSALRGLAAKIHADERVEMTLATIGDGLSIVVKR
ncbi:MAG: O-methyltransferase [Caulobacteraceae bacterium]